MDVIGAFEMAMLRQEQDKLMTYHTAVIVNYTEVPDGAGGRTTVESVDGPFPCRIFPRRREQGEDVAGGYFFQEMIWEIYFSVGVHVHDSSRVIVDGTMIYEVKAVLSPHTFETATLVYGLRI